MTAYLAFEFGDEPMMADADSAYVEAVEAEYERSVESKRAIAMTMLSQARLHEILIEEIAVLILSRAREISEDFEEEYCDCTLSEALGDKDNWWGVRRPCWPENCSVAISPSRTNFCDVYSGVRSPDPHNKSIDKGDDCASRSTLSIAVASVEGGATTGWWT